MINPFTEPITEILGGPNIFLEEGNNLNLTCVVRDSPEPPQYIFWYRNSQVKWISYILYKTSRNSKQDEILVGSDYFDSYFDALSAY